MIIIINVILWIWSHFPILCLSDDDNFATLEYKNLKSKNANLRFSLLNIMLGDYILYIVTFDIKKRKLELIHILCLENIDGILLTDEKIDGIQNRYRFHLQGLSESELEIEKESLCYRIQNEEQRINTSIDKLNIYATIILTVLPLVLAILDIKKVLTLSLSLLIGVILIIYSLLNICIYLFRTIKVRGIMKSSFRDLRSSKEKDKEIVLQYQYDWQQLKYKAQLFVSFVLNLQEWVVLTLVLSLLVSFGISFEYINNEISMDTVEYNLVTTINRDKVDEPYSDSAIEWGKLIVNIEKKQLGKVIFILSDDEDISFIDKLEKYKKLDIIIVRDKTLEKGQIKIIEGE
ncbi:hypothetical protein [Tissierella praeacuta]|uniref:hypothetical protein n=1 Tax=Tissierella praeacuta TaxID=43131 RepID=UPI0028B001D4|nr:hypothetical protein [Tissierella praeacuta]